MEYWQIQEIMITIVAVLVPVFALTYRFVLKPSRGDRGRIRGEHARSEEVLRDTRLDAIERQLGGAWRRRFNAWWTSPSSVIS